jgi:uncharacterized protein (DUF885 family)
MGQYAMEPVQPFKTEKDYTNFLKRMDTYSIWLDSAMVYMKKESKRSCTTKGVDCEDDSNLQICPPLLSKIICFILP